MTTHSNTLAWKIPWTEEPGRLQSMGSRRVGHDRATSLFTFMHWRRKWQPTLVFLPGESQGRGSVVGCRLWGCTELDTTEATQQQQQQQTLETGDTRHLLRCSAWPYLAVAGGVCWGGVLVLAVLILNHPGLTLADHAQMLNCTSLIMLETFLGFKWKTDLHVDKKIASLNLMILSSSSGVKQTPVCRDNLQLVSLGCLLS